MAVLMQFNDDSS